MSNDWSRNSSPPPPTFLNKPERDFQKQITDEVLERVIGQQIMYFPVDLQSTYIHPLYLNDCTIAEGCTQPKSSP